MVMSPTNSWVEYYCWIRHCTSSTSRPTNSETIITMGPVTSASITDTSSANSHPKYIVHWPQTPTEIVHIQNIKVLHHSRKKLWLVKYVLQEELHNLYKHRSRLLSWCRQKLTLTKVRHRVYICIYIYNSVVLVRHNFHREKLLYNHKLWIRVGALVDKTTLVLNLYAIIMNSQVLLQYEYVYRYMYIHTMSDCISSI